MQPGEREQMRGAALSEGGDRLPGEAAPVAREEGLDEGRRALVGEGEGVDPGAETGGGGPGGFLEEVRRGRTAAKRSGPCAQKAAEEE